MGMSQPIGAVRIDAEEFSPGKIPGNRSRDQNPSAAPSPEGFFIEALAVIAIDPAGSWKPEH